MPKAARARSRRAKPVGGAHRLAVVRTAQWMVQVATLCSAPTFDEFIERAFHILPQLVPCDFVSAVYQREGSAGAGMMRERDSLGRRWSAAFMRRYAELTPAIPHLQAEPGLRLVTSRQDIPHPEPELRRTAFYREVMKPQGWRHAAALLFWPEAPTFPILSLPLYRRPGRKDFTAREVALLDSLQPLLQPTLQRFHQSSSADALTAAIAVPLHRSSHAMLVLDAEMRVVRANLAAKRACARWGDLVRTRASSTVTDVRVPTAIQAACRSLLNNVYATVRKHPKAATKRHQTIVQGGASGLEASITAIHPGTALSDPVVIVEFDVRPASQDSTERVSVLERLTRAEREVAFALAEGLTNDEIAERLSKTVHAVKFLLHGVYRKLEVSHRARALLLIRQQLPADLSKS